MTDQRFHKKTSLLTLKEIAEIAHCRIAEGQDENIKINDVSPIDHANAGDLTFLQNKKYKNSLALTKASACILSELDAKDAPDNLALLISEDPYFSYALVTQALYKKADESFEVSEKADVDFSANIGKNTVIMAGAYIGENCIIGENCVIHPNTTITHSIIGDNVIIHPGCSIGQDGFGYAFSGGKHHKVMQLGRVIIKNDVEIGANSTIDRGAGPDTIIGEGTKIDNLVQIGHNVEVGNHCIIVSHVGISGSTKIGDYTVIGGQVGVAGHLKIGSGVQIAAQSGVMKDVADKEIIGGSPAIPIKEFHRQTIAVKKLANKNNNKT